MAGHRATVLTLALATILAMSAAGQLALHQAREAKEAARVAEEAARAAAFADVQPSAGPDAPLSLEFDRRGGLLWLPAAIGEEQLAEGLFLDSWTWGVLPVTAGETEMVHLPSVSLPGAVLRGMPFQEPLPARQTLAGCQAGSGLLGTGLLGRGIWRLDLPAGQLTQLPDSAALPASAGVDLTLDDLGGLRVAFDLAGAGRVSAALWFGTPLPLLISQDVFLAAGGTLPEESPRLQGRLWEGPGLPEAQAWRIGVLPRLKLDGLILEDVPSLVDSASRGMLVLGGRLFSSSRMTFDLAASRLYVSSVEPPNLETWPGLEQGLVLGHDGHQPILEGVWQGSPAFAAGLRPGDRLIALNRRAVASLNRRDFCAFLIADWPNWNHTRGLIISVSRGEDFISRVLGPWNALEVSQAAKHGRDALANHVVPAEDASRKSQDPPAPLH